jgi:hypothetical protein
VPIVTILHCAILETKSVNKSTNSGYVQVLQPNVICKQSLFEFKQALPGSIFVSAEFYKLIRRCQKDSIAHGHQTDQPPVTNEMSLQRL